MNILKINGQQEFNIVVKSHFQKEDIVIILNEKMAEAP